jgi:hypothetical protein
VTLRCLASDSSSLLGMASHRSRIGANRNQARQADTIRHGYAAGYTAAKYAN